MAEQLSKAEAIRRAELEYVRDTGIEFGSKYKELQIVHSLYDHDLTIEYIADVVNLSIEETKGILAMNEEDLTYEKLDANNYLRPIR